MAKKMSCLVVGIAAVLLVLDLGAAVPVRSLRRSNNLMKPATKEALKRLWSGFRAVDYIVVSACLVYIYIYIVHVRSIESVTCQKQR